MDGDGGADPARLCAPPPREIDPERDERRNESSGPTPRSYPPSLNPYEPTWLRLTNPRPDDRADPRELDLDPGCEYPPTPAYPPSPNAPDAS